MSTKYLLLNIAFLSPLLVVSAFHLQTILTWNMLRAFTVLCILTAVFDNIMIKTGMMRYDPTSVCGLMIGVAPIEDFAYTLAAVLFVALWLQPTNTKDVT